MAISEIEILLRQTIGLDSASIGLSLIERAVQQRLVACGLKDLSAYLEKIHSSTTELQELVEAVVVSETWFFRDEEAFTTLAHFAIQDWRPSNPHRKLRVLSIPCATGEEAYSMAMALDGIGMPAESYQIDAVDISEQALALARRAIYSKNSFRSKNLDFRDRYFKAGPHGYHLVESIRRQVLFQQRNLLSPDFFPGSHSFHFIFCRNLLIYLDQSAQDRAIRALKRLLAPEGVLFVGPAEAALMFNHDLVSIKRPMAFAFRQVKAIVVPPKQPTRQKTVSLRSKPAAFAPPVFKSRPHLKTQRVSITRSKSLLSGKIGADLKLAHRLADEGRLEEAIKACNNYLKEHSSSVEALHLLGVICEAKGDRERAGGYFRKVLYLNPEHHESLMHLAYSAEKEGNISAAQNLRARAQRVKERRPHV